MYIDSHEKYIPSLTKLWHEVFLDDKEYIDIFFKKAYFDSECLAHMDKGEIVSSLYLLKSHISSGGKIYHGRYLYAAATNKDFRGRGLMSQLIFEAETLVRDKGLDFIALVPAEESLYDYYSRFGYKTSMYKYLIRQSPKEGLEALNGKIKSKAEFYNDRKSNKCDMLFYDEVISDYAYDCLSFIGEKVISLGEKSHYINSQELFCGDGDEDICSLAPEKLAANYKPIFSNYHFNLGEKIKNGMILPINKQLENKEIYMNIALD